jgi:hypothetical protein
MPSPIAFGPLPSREVSDFVCAWCGDGMLVDQRSGATTTNYGICDPCLADRMHNLDGRNLTVAASAQGRDRLGAPCTRELSARPT